VSVCIGIYILHMCMCVYVMQKDTYLDISGVLRNCRLGYVRVETDLGVSSVVAAAGCIPSPINLKQSYGKCLS